MPIFWRAYEQWDLGFAEDRVKQIDAWPRLFALFAIALMAWFMKLPRHQPSIRYKQVKATH